MKVTLQKDYRKFYTLDDLDRAKAIIAFEKENDEETPSGWAAYAIREAGENAMEILKAEARTAKNCRVWNQYGDNSEDLDVWIEATAETTSGFIKIGAYLSDIWQSGVTKYKQHMFIKKASFQ